ncbi:MAG TPA: NAD-dependent epimerase/dehydratase family protein, partial [Paracoccus sp.]|nr:NAD-dependent epimerase/dehydratase family protein [Paracoccus sp. (in: a-proteobacteria)]
MKRVALLTGVSGQDGSYLAEFLLERGYLVHGLVPFPRAALAVPGVSLHFADLTDASGLGAILEEVEPDEVYNLAA